MKKTILYIGGVLNLLLALLHIFFWKILNWNIELIKLSSENQGVIQIMNICIIYLLIYFSIMSFIMLRKNKVDLYAKSIISLIAGFYFIRLVLGYPFFGFSFEELLIWIICLLFIISHTFLLFAKSKI